MSSSSKKPSSPKQSVGPDYRDEKQKPTATVSTAVPFENVHTLAQTPQLIALLT
jgi:uracil phosphoribosyltransferase